MSQGNEENWQCDHDMLPVRRMANGIETRLGYQCTRCGKWDGPKERSHFGRSCDFADFDEVLAQGFCNKIASQFATESEQHQETEKGRWWSIYKQFIRSDVWRFTMRTLVMERDGRICQSCLRMPADQVHHVRYPSRVESVADFENQPLYEMQAVCKKCHQKIHPNRELR